MFGVAALTDIPYYEGEDEHPKHKLDIFLPLERHTRISQCTYDLMKTVRQANEGGDNEVTSSNNSSDDEDEPDAIKSLDASPHANKRISTELSINFHRLRKHKKPVIMFIHGGGWKKGDKQYVLGLYSNVGRSLSSHGYITVIPSYRLSWLGSWITLIMILFWAFFSGLLGCSVFKVCNIITSDQIFSTYIILFLVCIFIFTITAYMRKPLRPVQHPGHILDCAHALKWIINNIEKYGGDPTQIFIMGHSAGAHLAILLAMDEQWSKQVNISSKQFQGIKAMIGICGAYNPQRLKDVWYGKPFYLWPVFGRDSNKWDAAFPLVHSVKKSKLPPCLLINAERDWGLELHANDLATNLKKNNNTVETHIIKKTNHFQIIADVGKLKDWSDVNLQDIEASSHVFSLNKQNDILKTDISTTNKTNDNKNAYESKPPIIARSKSLQIATSNDMSKSASSIIPIMKVKTLPGSPARRIKRKSRIQNSKHNSLFVHSTNRPLSANATEIIPPLQTSLSSPNLFNGIKNRRRSSFLIKPPNHLINNDDSSSGSSDDDDNDNQKTTNKLLTTLSQTAPPVLTRRDQFRGKIIPLKFDEDNNNEVEDGTNKNQTKMFQIKVTDADTDQIVENNNNTMNDDEDSESGDSSSSSDEEVEEPMSPTLVARISSKNPILKAKIMLARADPITRLTIQFITNIIHQTDE